MTVLDTLGLTVPQASHACPAPFQTLRGRGTKHRRACCNLAGQPIAASNGASTPTVETPWGFELLPERRPPGDRGARGHNKWAGVESIDPDVLETLQNGCFELATSGVGTPKGGNRSLDVDAAAVFLPADVEVGIPSCEVQDTSKSVYSAGLEGNREMHRGTAGCRVRSSFVGCGYTDDSPSTRLEEFPAILCIAAETGSTG